MVDESVTGSVNFWSDTSSRIDAAVNFHLRLPAFDRGVTSFLWAFFFFLYIWLGGVAVGFDGAVSFIVAAVAGFLSFLLIRLYGEDEPRTP
jgi:hypothetical protein